MYKHVHTLCFPPPPPSQQQLPSDSHILRFLRARDFHVEKAREMLCRSLAWRKRYNVDQLLATYTPPDVIKTYYSGGWHHHDKGTQCVREYIGPYYECFIV